MNVSDLLHVVTVMLQQDEANCIDYMQVDLHLTITDQIYGFETS